MLLVTSSFRLSITPLMFSFLFNVVNITNGKSDAFVPDFDGVAFVQFMVFFSLSVDNFYAFFYGL